MVRFRIDRFKEKVNNFINTNEFIGWLLLRLHAKDTREYRRNYRIVYVNKKKPTNYKLPEDVIDERIPFRYATNAIRTSKYTPISFLPKNLFEQFRRLANLYFLINTIFLIIIPDPNISPYIAALPLIIYLTIIAIKQGYEDILRHIADNNVNRQPVEILREGRFQKMKWKDIACGDIIKVNADQIVPCDLILLSSSSPDRTCYIKTASLDGETNLKLRQVPLYLPSLSTEQELSELQAAIHCDIPNPDLYKFNGKMIIDGQEQPLIQYNVLLRDTSLQISSFIYGVAIYTGHETKMMKNSVFVPNKRSKLEFTMNAYMIYFISLLGVISLFSLIGSIYFYPNSYTSNWYLNGTQPSYYNTTAFYNFVMLLFFIILYNDIIPLFLYMAIEFQRTIGTRFIEWDLEMYDEKTDQPAKANTSDLNEDLGQIEYLFSDKTGTLTENEMEFIKFSIGDKTYHESDQFIYDSDNKEKCDILSDEKMLKFFECLVLCHTAQIDKTDSEKFQATSPEEFCYLNLCKRVGIVYMGEEKSEDGTKLIRKVKFLRDVNDENSEYKIKRYRVLNLFEFDSTRKRMSILVKDLDDHQVILFCKGADSAILTNCSNSSNRNSAVDHELPTSTTTITEINQCYEKVKEFGRLGLRTIVLSYRNFEKSQYKELSHVIKAAYNDILNRDKKIDQLLHDKIELDFNLLGSIAVEDKLQEDVAGTLELLRNAGIKIWVLTGDYTETAVNVSKTCGHIPKDCVIHMIENYDKNANLLARFDSISKEITRTQETTAGRFNQVHHENQTQSIALVIDGVSLCTVKAGKLDEEFCSMALQCDAVLCCRMSPAQKALIVKMVKHSKGKPLTAAIGDGANDVSMIQKANIGIGIFGKEGRNAARAADFAFTKFRYLKRLILVHGYLYYTRSAILVQYTFYKNIPYVFSYFFYSFFTAFSATSVHDAPVSVFYNILFTAVPIIFFGLFEQRVPIDLLRDNPSYYKSIRNNRLLTPLQFIKWNIIGFYHAVICFFFVYAFYCDYDSLSSDGKLSGTYYFGPLVFILILAVIHVKLAFDWSYKTLWLPFSFMISILSVVLILITLNSFIMPDPLTMLTDNQAIYWVYNDILSKPGTWFLILLTMVTSAIPDVALGYLENVGFFEPLKNKLFKRKFSKC